MWKIFVKFPRFWAIKNLQAFYFRSIWFVLFVISGDFERENRDGKEKGIPSRSRAPFPLFLSGGLQVCERSTSDFLVLIGWTDGRTDERTDETGPDGSHTPLNWSIRKSWWSPRGSAGAFTVDRVQISLFPVSLYSQILRSIINSFSVWLFLPRSCSFDLQRPPSLLLFLSLSHPYSRHFSPFIPIVSASIHNL